MMMNEKQLTIREVIDKIGRGKCLYCGERIDLSITYHWRIPLCRLCRIEALEDLAEVK